MDKIKGQAAKVGALVFASETASAYQKTLSLTWQILRETAILLWLVLCLLFVGGEWLWKTATYLGQQTRTWYEGLSQPTPQEKKSLGEMGQSLLTTLQGSATTLLYTAKTQLGMEADPPTPPTPSVPPTPVPSPPVTPPPPPLGVADSPIDPPAPLPEGTIEPAASDWLDEEE